MPELRPFRGVRYSSSEQLKAVICPPYDIIGPEEQERLYARHPHNAVRLELARGDAKYRDAARTYERWLEEGVLVPDENPTLYVYRQDFTDPEGRPRRVAGIVGDLELEEFGGDGGVLPHERTMAGPKADRLELMRALPVNVSPIFAIYRGGGGLAPYFTSLENRPAAARAADDQGVLHRMWTVTAPAEIEMLRDALRPGPLVIADGHHRYETALAYHRERDGVSGPHDGIMCYCVDADAEELLVLPYDRAFRPKEPGDDIRERARSMFGATAAGPGALDASDADHPLLVVFPDEDLLIELSDADVVGAVGARARAWRDLDVVALHEVVIPKVAPGAEEFRFSRSEEDIRALAAEGWIGVLLRAVRPAQIVDVASSGERMPQKASYFWPKAVTGLVLRSLR
ncbi:MAG: DUF1015 family protein [Actinobacteria bacterium]|nr:DUF1015 family protein [Actinomycetota bacterium]